jgi:hypothetical protein
LLPEGEIAVEDQLAEPVSGAVVADRLRTLRFHPPGVDQRVRVYRPLCVTAGMFLNGVRRIDAITRHDLVEEATSWGMSRIVATDRVERLLVGAARAIERAVDELGSPADIVATLDRRAASIAAG